jgi:hypothetical protein
MVELGYTQAVDVKLVADSQDNRNFLISLAICILPFLVSSLVSISPFKPL